MDRAIVDARTLTWSDAGYGDVLYEGAAFTGIAYEAHPRTQRLLSLSGYRDGKPHGPSRRWYSNTQMEQEVYFHSGHHHGPLLRWFAHGQLEEAGYIHHGVPLWRKRWNAQGDVLEARDANRDPALLHALQAILTSTGSEVHDICLDTWEFIERPAGWRMHERW